MWRFGRFELTSVDSGSVWVDGGMIFGGVPRSVWQTTIATDASHRIRLAVRLLLIVDRQASPPRRILIDTGLGDKGGPAAAVAMLYQPPRGGLASALRRVGAEMDEITDVIVTHLHFDHVGGATRRLGDGNLAPSFPRATYHLQRRALKWAGHASERDADWFHSDDYDALARAGSLHLLDGPQELFDGITLILSEGHTVAQQLPLIEGSSERLLFCGDLIPTQAHVQLAWMLSHDLYPLTSLEEKRLLLAEGLAESWILFFEHDPDVVACRLAECDERVVAGDPLVF